jgi:hypothetical protein
MDIISVVIVSDRHYSVICLFLYMLAVLFLIEPLGFCSNTLNILVSFGSLRKHPAQKYFRGLCLPACHGVIGCLFPDTLNDYSAFMYEGKLPETRNLQNGRSHLTVDTVSHFLLFGRT